MPAFRYRAISASGKLVNGEMTAPSEASVIERLNDLGHYPIRAERIARLGAVRPKLSSLLAGTPSPGELSVVMQELARMINAEVPIEQALEILIDVAESRRVRRLLGNLLTRLRRGETLAQAMEAQGDPVKELHVSMIHAGEAGGSLGQALGQLADYMRESRHLRAAVLSACIYPGILLCVSVMALVLLLTFVVPRFEQMFESAGAALPLATQIVIGTAAWLQDQWMTLLLIALCLLILLRLVMAAEGGRFALDSLLLSLPLFGRLIRQLETARMCRTLATLLTNGVTLPHALPIVRDVLTNRPLRQAIETVLGDLKAGKGFADRLRGTGRFPALASHMIRVGEETGQLDRMLMDIAEIYEEELRKTLQRLLMLLEPAIILSLGVMVGGIIVSILLAVVSINQLAF